MFSVDRKNTLVDLYRHLPPGSRVLDVGCLGFGQLKASQSLGRQDLVHSGVDYCQPEAVPSGFDFHLADLNRDCIPFPDDSFDLVVASHIIEHLSDPVRSFGDCLRVCKPGGFLYVAAPSERSLWLPGFPFAHEKFYSLSFFDDPTHAHRPFSAVSLVRLSRYYGCLEVEAHYVTDWKCRVLLPLAVLLALIFRDGTLLEVTTWRAVGWECVAVARKPRDVCGLPRFTYYIPDRPAGPVLRLYRKIRGA